MFLLTFRPRKPLSLVRQHRVIRTRPDGDSGTRLVYFLAACIQLQPLFVCCTCDALPIMGSSNARSTSVARPVWLRSSVLSSGQPGRKSSVSAWTHPTSGDNRRSSQSRGEGQRTKRRRQDSKSPAGDKSYLKHHKCNSNSRIAGACWRGWEVGRTLMQVHQRVTKHQRKSRCARCACKWETKGMDSSHVLQVASARRAEGSWGNWKLAHYWLCF